MISLDPKMSEEKATVAHQIALQNKEVAEILHLRIVTLQRAILILVRVFINLVPSSFYVLFLLLVTQFFASKQIKVLYSPAQELFVFNFLECWFGCIVTHAQNQSSLSCFAMLLQICLVIFLIKFL